MEAPNPDRCLARRLRFNGPNSTSFYSGLMAALSFASKISVDDLLNEEKYDDDAVAALYDIHMVPLDAPRRPPTKTELAAADRIQNETLIRDTLRTRKSTLYSLEKQVTSINERIADLQEEIKTLEGE